MYAHQSSGSFNAAAKDAAVEVLKAKDYAVEVSDLYAMKFKATATAEDIIGIEQHLTGIAVLVLIAVKSHRKYLFCLDRGCKEC